LRKPACLIRTGRSSRQHPIQVWPAENHSAPGRPSRLTGPKLILSNSPPARPPSSPHGKHTQFATMGFFAMSLQRPILHGTDFNLPHKAPYPKYTSLRVNQNNKKTSPKVRERIDRSSFFCTVSKVRVFTEKRMGRLRFFRTAREHGNE
jgi:hypothetical protein